MTDTTSYLRQLANAAKDEQRFYEALRKAGWVYNPVTQEWTHPNSPDVTVSR